MPVTTARRNLKIRKLEAQLRFLKIENGSNPVPRHVIDGIGKSLRLSIDPNVNTPKELEKVIVDYINRHRLHQSTTGKPLQLQYRIDSLLKSLLELSDGDIKKDKIPKTALLMYIKDICYKEEVPPNIAELLRLPKGTSLSRRRVTVLVRDLIKSKNNYGVNSKGQTSKTIYAIKENKKLYAIFQVDTMSAKSLEKQIHLEFDRYQTSLKDESESDSDSDSDSDSSSDSGSEKASDDDDDNDDSDNDDSDNDDSDNDDSDNDDSDNDGGDGDGGDDLEAKYDHDMSSSEPVSVKKTVAGKSKKSNK